MARSMACSRMNVPLLSPAGSEAMVFYCGALACAANAAYATGDSAALRHSLSGADLGAPLDCSSDAKRFTSRRSNPRRGAAHRENRGVRAGRQARNPLNIRVFGRPRVPLGRICKRYHLMVDKCGRGDNHAKRFTVPSASTNPNGGCRTEVPGNGPVPLPGGKHRTGVSTRLVGGPIA